MQWYEILIIIAAVGFVVGVAARGIVRRKKHPGSCGCCSECAECGMCSAKRNIEKQK